MNTNALLSKLEQLKLKKRFAKLSRTNSIEKEIRKSEFNLETLYIIEEIDKILNNYLARKNSLKNQLERYSTDNLQIYADDPRFITYRQNLWDDYYNISRNYNTLLQFKKDFSNLLF